MPQPDSVPKAVQSPAQAISSQNYLWLATLLEGREGMQRVHKKDPHGEALRKAGQLYANREYAPAYESFKPVYDKIVADMQRIFARNPDFEANKMAKEQQKSLAAAKESIQKLRTHAQDVTDQLSILLQDLERRPLVRLHLKKGQQTPIAPGEEAPPTRLSSANETTLDAVAASPPQVSDGGKSYRKAPYSPPEVGDMYCVRDKERRERIIRVIGKSADGDFIDVEALDGGKPSGKPFQLAVDSLARQAAKGWCTMLIPVTQTDDVSNTVGQPAVSLATTNVTMRLDIQNFGRCSADIVRANIKFDTQLIKDVGDGPFRAGNFEQAFLTFEQFALGFTTAVANSRRAIADGRRALTAEKGKLSGKEIQERTAAFIRNEHLIHTAEREFSTILEGLRMYLRSQQD